MKMYSSARHFKNLIVTGLIIFTAHFQAFSQTYQVNGTAVNNGNGLVRLTTSQASVAQTASAWSTTKIDLTQPFDMSFEMFFGCNKNPATGGDGMTFTLHNDPRGLAATGAGFGFLGIGGAPVEMVKPALSIEFDTYDASGSGGSNEIPEDHIAIDLNGDVNVGQPFTGSAGTTVTVQAVANTRDLEDCSENGGSFYKIRITWDPVTKTLQLFEEGSTTASLTYTNDLIVNLFGNVNEVYWGFTGATGTAANEQWIAPQGTIIPWECTAGTSCCVPFTVTPSSPTTICNNPITLAVAGSYDSYSWSDGTTGTTTQVSLPGTYTVNVFQLQQPGNVSCPGSATFTITPTGPTATLSGGATFCNTSQTTPLSVALTGTSPWTLVYAIDGVNQPAVTGITTSPYVFQANASHVYSLVSVADNSGCNSTATGSATVDLYPGIPTGHDDFFTAPGTADLSVDNDGGTYVWYDAPTGGNVVYNGTNYPSPILNTTTTYYVENTAVTAVIPKTISFDDNLDGDGANKTFNNNGGLPRWDLWVDFKANTNFKLDRVTPKINVVLPWQAGSGLHIYIDDQTAATSITIDSIFISPLPSGEQSVVIPINYSFISGHNYRISYEGINSIKGILYWQMVSGYPINNDPEITLTNSAQNTTYPGIFKWEISVPSPSSSCGRTPVTAYTCPKAVLSGDAIICNDGSTTLLSVALTGRYPVTLIYAIDGVSQTPITITSTDPNPYKITSATGAHTYTLVSVSNNDCNGTVTGTANVTLTAQAPIGHDDNFTAPGTALLSVDPTGDTFDWYDAATGGNLVYTGDNFPTPILNSTTTYYVNNASIVNVVSKTISFDDNLDGNGANKTFNNNGGLPRWDLWVEFKANTNFKLDRVTPKINVVLPWQVGSGLHIYIDDQTAATSITIDSIFTSPLPSGEQSVVIPINYSFISGHNYRISYEGINSIKGILYWQMVSGYPINNDPEITLTNSAQNTTYPGIFKWEISIVSSTPACGRTPVTAYVCPTAVLSGDAVICDDGNTTTNLSVALTGASPWTLTYAIDGVNQTAITGITSTPYTITSATGAHVYTLVSVGNATSTGCTNGTSGTATVTVNPNAPVGHDATFLPGNPANLSVDNTGGTFNWFTTATGSTSVNSTNTYSPSLTSTTTYYVQHVDGNGDTSCTRTPVTAYLCPTAGLSGNAVICNDGTSTTTLSVVLDGDAPWSIVYAIDGVNQPAITNINSTTYQFASATGAHVYTLVSVSNATSTGCANGTSGTATVTVKPDAPIGHNATFTSPGTALLSVTNNPGSTYNWYTASTGGILVNTGDTYTTPTLTASTTYYVDQTIGGETSCTRTPVTAIIFVPTVPLFIPNLMTPNNDGKNDRFEILGLPDGSTLGVYNRWGNAVYQSDNYNNQWAAENISAGVYYYDLKLKNGETYKGWLQIIW